MFDRKEYCDMPEWLIIVLPVLSVVWLISIEYRKQKLEEKDGTK